jgi:hypothetical protein
VDKDKESTNALIEKNGITISSSADEGNYYTKIAQLKNNDRLVLVVTLNGKKQFKQEVISALNILTGTRTMKYQHTIFMVVMY